MSIAATGANAVLQPYFSEFKPSGAGTGTLDVDMVQVGMNWLSSRCDSRPWTSFGTE
jgi:hypothetical protein